MPVETINYEGYEIKIDTTDPAHPSLKINNKDIHIEYDASKDLYSAHLFFRNFESLEVLAKYYIKNNPDLLDVHGGHHA